MCATTKWGMHCIQEQGKYCFADIPLLAYVAYWVIKEQLLERPKSFFTVCPLQLFSVTVGHYLNLKLWFSEKNNYPNEIYLSINVGMYANCMHYPWEKILAFFMCIKSGINFDTLFLSIFIRFFPFHLTILENKIIW